MFSTNSSNKSPIDFKNPVVAGGAGAIGLLLILVIIMFSLWQRSESTHKKDLENIGQLQNQAGNPGEEEAERIIERVKRHILINEDVEPTVATIVDVETLKRRNPFYAKAKNGDHLIVTPERAILYDSDADILLDIIPVQIKPLEQ